MRVLVVLVHYFAPEAAPRHSSVDGSRREQRRRVVETVIESYRGQFGSTGKLRFSDRSVEIRPAAVDLDIQILTVPGCSLIDDDFRRRHGVVQAIAAPEDPRRLGFVAYHVFARLARDYDWFVYSEDDLAVRDPLFFDKLVWFNATFGDRRVLSPNRFEWNRDAHRLKTYIDGDISPATFEALTRPLPDDDVLTARPFLREEAFRRARNPHSGFFAVTRAQLARWMAAPHWLDPDASFVSPLESAATLGLARTFAVYKPDGASTPFLEIEHLDSRFSGMGLPVHRPDLPPEIAR